MKLLPVLMVTLLLSPVTALAISMSDLTNNPDQYKKVHEDGDYITYIDTSSVESLRYSPPYYTMRCESYMASYNQNLVFECTLTVDYDYTRSMKTLITKILDEDTKMGIIETYEQIYKKYEDEKRQDAGLRVSLTNMKRWDLNGNFEDYIPPSYGRTPPYGTRAEIAASHLFEEYYNERF